MLLQKNGRNIYIYHPESRTPEQKIVAAENDQKQKEREFSEPKKATVPEVILPTWRDKYSLPWNEMIHGYPNKRTPEQILFLANIQTRRNDVEESNIQLNSVTELVIEEKIDPPEKT